MDSYIPVKRKLRCAVKNGVHVFKQRLDLHSIAAQIVQVTDNLIFPGYAACYRRFDIFGQ